MSQHQYVLDMLKEFGMEQCTPVSTPMEPGLKLSHKTYGPKTDDDHFFMKDKPYRRLIGKLQYLSVVSRPDITYAVNILCRFLAEPGPAMWNAAIRVLKYLKGTSHYGLTYRRSLHLNVSSSATTKPLHNQSKSWKAVHSSTNIINSYADADWGGNEDNRKSTSGYVNYIGNTPVSWRSKLQSVVAQSTAEAEYIAINNVARDVIWLRRLLSELQLLYDGPTTIYSDNQSAIAISKGDDIGERSKHIDIKYHYVKDLITNNDINIEYCPTKLQIADIMTKALGRPQFEYLRTLLGIEDLRYLIHPRSPTTPSPLLAGEC
jgi:hypothetical protein